MDDEVKTKAIHGAFAGPMAYLVLSTLSGGKAMFDIKPDFSAYITKNIRTESEAWQVGDPEREHKEAAAAAAEQPFLDAYRAVVVPRPENDEGGLGARMADALAALNIHCREVLLHVCNGKVEMVDALLKPEKKTPVARAALAAFHLRAYPGQATWVNYNAKGKDRAPRVGIPYEYHGRKKKQLMTWACRGFMVALPPA